MRKTTRAALLMLVLATSAYAGNMPNGATEPPPPPVSVAESADGNMPNGTTDTATQVTLNLLHNLLTLF
jgi:hypothetical protein